ncbi:MAG: hypothetical protein R6U20_05995 [Longimonas sp.]|uniref:hypothetical protein n=1 Tax=Longimonas sp. TaxID=2039626 RepID=UPI0039753D72
MQSPSLAQRIVAIFYVIVGTLVSVGFGGFLVYVVGIDLYQEGDLLGAVIATLFGLVIAGGGLTIVVRVLIPKLKQKDADPDTPDRPWHVRPEWRTNELVEEASWSWGGLVFSGLLASMFVLMGPYLLYIELTSADADQLGGAIIATVIGTIGGTVIAWLYAKKVMRQQKFGRSRLVLEDMPGRLGRPLRMRLWAGIDEEDLSGEGLKVKLTCYKQRIEKEQKRDDDGDVRTVTTTKNDPLWQDVKHVHGRRKAGSDQLEIPVLFELPDDQPPTTPEDKRLRTYWTFKAYADLPGVDYETEFEVPVFEPDEETVDEDVPEEDTTTTEAETEHTASWEQKGDGTSGALAWNLSAPAEDEPDPAQEPEAAHAEAEDASGGADAGDSFDMREVEVDQVQSEKVTLERPADGRLKLHVAPPEHTGMGVGLGVLAVGFVALSLFMWSSALGGALISLVSAGIFGYGAWKSLTYVSTVVVEDGELRSTRGPFGYGSEQRIPCSHVDTAGLTQMVQLGSSRSYGVEVKVSKEGLTQDARARASWWASILSFAFSKAKKQASKDKTKRTGASDAETEEALHKAADEILDEDAMEDEMLEDEATKLIAAGLPNKPEAEWIAERIEEAVHQEAHS